MILGFGFCRAKVGLVGRIILLWSLYVKFYYPKLECLRFEHVICNAVCIDLKAVIESLKAATNKSKKLCRFVVTTFTPMKVSTIFLMLLYLVPTVGINCTVHYCGGEVASITVNNIGKSEKCPCGTKRISKKCCEDKDFSLEFGDESFENKTDNFRLHEIFSSCLNTVQYEDISFIGFDDVSHSEHQLFAPFDRRLYLKHQVFLI